MVDINAAIDAYLDIAPPPIRPEMALSVDSIAVDGHTLAKALGLTNRAVTQLAKEGVAVKLGRGSFDLVESTRRYCEKMRKPDGDAGRRLKEANAQLAEMRLAEVKQELVSAGAVESRWADILQQVKAETLGAVSKIQAALPHLSPFDVTTIDHHLRRALTDLGGGNGNS
jgi:phage terminase Nu1 subunit (DNA packaging protein)